MANVPSLLPAPRLPSGLEPRLVELAEQRMLSPARQANYELRLVGATVLPQRQTIARTQYGTWLFVDHAHDPTRTQRFKGKIPIPLDVRAQLAELYQAGVWPDVAWVAHQVDDQWQEGMPVHVPTPRHLRDKDERLTQRLKRGTELFLKGSGAVLTIAASAPVVAAGAVASLGAGLDPIIFGGVRHPQAPGAVVWVALAQWEWE